MGKLQTFAILQLVLLPAVWACVQPVGWKHKSEQERFPLAKNVVYGKFLKELKSVPFPNRDVHQVDFQFQVYCVLKSTQGSMLENITIVSAYPPTCTKEDVVIVQEGNEAIVMLNRVNDVYYWDQVNVQAAVFNVTDARLKVAKIPATPPSGCCSLARSKKANQICGNGAATSGVSPAIAFMVSAFLLIFAM